MPRHAISWFGKALAAALLALALCAAVAQATTPGAGTTTTSTTTTTTGTTTPPVTGAIKPSSYWVHVPGLFDVHGDLVTVTGRQVSVQAHIYPYVAGQQVKFTEAVNGKVFKTVTLALKRSANGRFGWSQTTVVAHSAGRVTVRFTHAASTGLTAVTKTRAYQALSTQASVGSHGRFVQLIQQRLAALHFYIPQTGVFDQGTELALDAYHRLLGMGPSESLSPIELSDLLGGVGSFHVRFPKQGFHVEGDLSDQVLALINGSKVVWLLPISSGKYTTPTVIGSWQIYLRDPGYLPDGMYYSDFFYSGYAIHGYDPAPNYPASHGCMRLPIVDAIPVFNRLGIGDWVDTYGKPPFTWGGGAGWA